MFAAAFKRGIDHQRKQLFGDPRELSQGSRHKRVRDYDHGQFGQTHAF